MIARPVNQTGGVNVAGANLRFVVEGSGLPVLVVGSATYYPRTFSRRLRESCTLAFADLRHFAETEPGPEAQRVTFDTYAEEVERIREAIGFERFVIVGHSKHGNLALEYAKRHPLRASHVVLIGSPPVGLTRTLERREAYWATQASDNRKALLRQNLESLTPARLASLSPGEALAARYVAEGPKYWFDPTYDASPLWRGVPVNMPVLGKLHDLFADYEMTWDQARMPSPVLAIIGRHDYVVPHPLWDEVLPNLQNVTYHLFEESGHTPQLEEPVRFDQVFVDWLRRPASGTVVDAVGPKLTN